VTRADMLAAAAVGVQTATRDDDLHRRYAELQAEGLVRRTKIPGKPMCVWTLTEKGRRELGD
jgi:DNA-binding HxlR family transcriptional regulator